jgi:hypothetical protein
MWTNVRRPGDLFVGPDGIFYVGEMSWEKGQPNLAGRLWEADCPSEMSIRDAQGNLLAKWGGPDPCASDGLSSPHGLWVDSDGNINVGEVTHTALSQSGRWHEGRHSLVKYARI